MLLECPYGTIFSFDHIDCLHGSNPNPMNSTMVSFDFRLAVKDLYYDSDAGSVNMGSKFQPGSYFSSSALNSYWLLYLTEREQDISSKSSNIYEHQT